MKKIYYSLFLLGLSVSISAQTFYDEATVQTIEITFAQSNWDQLLDAEKNGNEDYIMATSVSINGTVLDSVGVKYKGNSTYNANQTKNPFHIELDTYKEHSYDGYKDIKLSNVANDPSFVREVLSYKILRQYMHAPLSNYANVYVNGTLIGLYSNSEAITKTFLESRFDSKKNAFFKCNPIDGAGPGSTDLPNLEYISQDTLDYFDAYEMKSDTGWQDLINLTDTLENEITAIENVLDVDRALWMLAFNNVLVNLDSYIGAFTQNYYLYRSDFNQFLPVVWDLNESFGRFAMTGSSNLNSTTAKQQMSHLLHENDADFPLVSQLLSVPSYKRKYLAHFKTILLENFDNGNYFTDGQALQTTIDADVQADPNKFFTYANFTSNLTSDITTGGGPGGGTTNGITSLMDGRSSYLLGLTDFTNVEPTISNVIESSASIQVNDGFYVNADITDENTVYLGYRTNTYAPFTKITMLDDGLNNDGAAGDGNYGAQLFMDDLSVEYYIYAENDDIGKFSPARAEHEFYEVFASEPTIGSIVINELQASNDNTIADQDGEYDDWIEIYNNSSISVDLSNHYLSDDANDLDQWQFPSGTTIGANDYILVWADKDDLQIGLHANFKLSSTSETVFLSDDQIQLVDQVSFANQIADVTYGRFVNGTGGFQLMNPTPSAENSGNEVGTIEELRNSLRVYPNPANERISILLNDDNYSDQEVLITDATGKIVFRETFTSQLEISVSNWADGIYFIKMDGFVSKLIKQ